MTYFAYGLNMDIEMMSQRCPSSTYMGIGILPRHVFQINALGVATAIWTGDVSQYVFGIFFNLSLDDETALDVFEGLGFAYTKEFVSVERQDDSVCQCMIYKAIDSNKGLPRDDGYLESIIAAAEGYKFPKIYIERLRSWLTK